MQVFAFNLSPFRFNLSAYLTVWPFNKKTTIAASGTLAGATDHHSHILPGVDDGVETMNEALRILATYETLGIKELWLTPHIMEDIPNTPQKLKARFDELKAAYTGNIKLHLAAEYMIDNHLHQQLQETNKLRHSQCEGRWHEQSEVTEGSKTTNNSPSLLRGAVRNHSTACDDGCFSTPKECPIGATQGERDEKLLPIGTAGKHILVETSYYNAPIRMNETLQQIKSMGYFPLLAHPERYMYLDNDEYLKLHNEGVRFQLNLASLAGGYGAVVRKKALWLLANGLYSVAGSDLHCEEAIEFITKSGVSRQNIEEVKRLLQNRI